MKTEIGEKQKGVLRALGEHGSWHPACGWIWNNESTTVRILESLVKRGLVQKVMRTNWRGTEHEVYEATYIPK